MIDKNMPAFPKPITKYMYATGSEVIKNNEDGISIQQYYAAKAMQGLVSRIDSLAEYFNENNITTREEITAKVAEIAHDYADAMIDYENKENK